MSQFIPLKEGIVMTKDYRLQRRKLIDDGVILSTLLPICETFEKEMVSRLLDKPDAHALRVYMGLQKGEVKLILVAADAENKDILPTATTTASEGDEDDNEDDLLDHGARCPDICPPESPLNP